MEKNLRVIFGGDVMLGRLVKIAIEDYGVAYPLGKIHPLLQQSDLNIFNLECAITSSTQLWRGAPKAFYFGALPIAAEVLANAKIHLVSLANNHSLDYDYQGLHDTITHLQQQHIHFVGAGDNIIEAQSSVIIERAGQLFGMVAFCDHQDDFAATVDHPGMAFLDLSNEKNTIRQFAQSLEKMRQQQVDWPILSLHWGPNMVDRPSEYFKQLAHQAIDLGYKIIYGHSAHVFHGVEIYRGCPILYAAGDCIDDYYVDEEFRNDHQLLFELEIQGSQLKRMVLHPIYIHQCRVQPANDREFDYIVHRITKLCKEMGTVLIAKEQKLIIEIS